MGHTFPVERADRLEDSSRRYRYVSREELLAAVLPAHRVMDLGSGTGFYADDVAPHVARLEAVDVQPGMHAYYREKGVPGNVELVTAEAAGLPFREASLDAVYTTMTYHEFASPNSLRELRRVLKHGARFVVYDWNADGEGEAGPPLDERYTLDGAVEEIRGAGFNVDHASSRPETFAVVAER